MGLIDGERFRKEFFKLETEFRPSQIDAVFDCVGKSETVDAVPVRHGRWVKGIKTKMMEKNRYLVLEDAFYCSECENEAYWDTDYGQQMFDYCPYCGADMRERRG